MFWLGYYLFKGSFLLKFQLMNIQNLVLIIPAFGILALLFTLWKTKQVNAHSEGSPRMAKIAASIQEGAMAFLKAEY